MKHPLLPDQYGEASMQTAIISALNRYERIGESADPHFKWDLRKAWQEAKPYLQTAEWHSQAGDAEEGAWELAADTDDESAILHIILAGLVARQMDDPESDLSVRRIDYRKGGETALIVSDAVKQKLHALFPDAHYHKVGEATPTGKAGIFTRIKAAFGKR